MTVSPALLLVCLLVALPALASADCPCQAAEKAGAVCGTNGQTYDSKCTLDCATADIKGLALAHAGPCQASSAVRGDVLPTSCLLSCTGSINPECVKCAGDPSCLTSCTKKLIRCFCDCASRAKASSAAISFLQSNVRNQVAALRSSMDEYYALVKCMGEVPTCGGNDEACMKEMLGKLCACGGASIRQSLTVVLLASLVAWVSRRE